MIKAYFFIVIPASAAACISCFDSLKQQSDEDTKTGSEVDNSSANTDTDTDLDAGTETDTDTHTDDTETFDSDAGAGDLVDTDTAPSIDVKVVLNPYEAVDWETWGQYKANFHTHTTNSDGDFSPEVVIEQYHSKSYDVLAITDHDYATWPWTDYGMDPSALGMLAVKGDEYSGVHDVNAFYNFTETDLDMATGIAHVHEQGGLSQINHPGSYAYSNETYLNYFEQFTSCVWLEVYNTGDRYPDDRERWDQINERLFYEQGRFAWGSSNDDSHSTADLYRNFQFMLAPKLTEDAIRTAQTGGAFYFAYEPNGSGDAKVPRIISIEVDNDAETITVNAADYDAVYWIGPGAETVAEGTVFNFSDYAHRARISFIDDVIVGYAKRPFVRFVLDGPFGDSYSQPFGFESTPVGSDITP
jgi:hypothetical protein